MFRMLGPVRFGPADSQAAVVRASKKRTLLAVLLLHANEWVETDAIVDVLWDGGGPPPSAEGSIKTYIWSLRKRVPLAADGGQRIERRSQAYRIRVVRSELDLFVFEDLMHRGHQHLMANEPVAAIEDLTAALGLWQGAPLPDLPGVFGEGARMRLEEQRSVGFEDLLEAKLALGLHAEVVGEARKLLAENRFRERLWRQLLVALYRSGRQAEALAAYQSLRRQFVDELGMEPGNEVRELHNAILARDASLDLASRVPAQGLQQARSA